MDRFLGLVLHVVNHSANARSLRLSNEDREDLCSDVFLELLKDDFAVLRNFRGQSSLATYLTVVARRVVVRRLVRQKASSLPLSMAEEPQAGQEADAISRSMTPRNYDNFSKVWTPARPMSSKCTTWKG